MFTMLSKNIFRIAFFVLILLLLYTRFVNLYWGLPYAFHPDEWNMAAALTRLSCDGLNTECFNPHFFAYGQFPLYVSYLGILIYQNLTGGVQIPVQFNEAFMGLRVVAASASVLTFIVLMKTAELLFDRGRKSLKNKLVQSNLFKVVILIGIGVLFIFSPALIQLAHFGTTESLLMLFYTTLVYLALLVIGKEITVLKYTVLSGIVGGVALATKISALSFLLLPALVLFFLVFQKKQAISKKTFTLVKYATPLILTAVGFFILLSPYNFITFKDFINSISYESAIGVGKFVVFYTRQFEMTIPIIFQFTAIFPYALGISITAFFVLGFILLPFNKEYMLLRVAFLIYFFSNAFLFTKWTRFMAPVFPIMLIIASMFLVYLLKMYLEKMSSKPSTVQNAVVWVCFLLIAFTAILPGIAYLSVYKNKDVRFTASEWIYQNVPADSVILSEAGNVVDLPIRPPYLKSNNLSTYQVISLHMYDLETNPDLALHFKESFEKAQYIVVPSRRVFANHTCKLDTLHNALHRSRCENFAKKYPMLNQYYDTVLTERLGFKKIKEFTAFPEIKLGPFHIAFPDEKAEETWTVFDHPVIRIYKKEQGL